MKKFEKTIIMVKWSNYMASLLVMILFTSSIIYKFKYMTNLKFMTYYLIIATIISISIKNFFYTAKSINKNYINKKYVYHCLSEDKLKDVYSNGIANLKPTKKKKFITDKKGVYFHSSLKKYSFYYNHIYRLFKTNYMLIIPVENLSDNLYKRKIDGAILDTKSYNGIAKCIKLKDFNLFKNYKKNIHSFFIDIIATTLILEPISTIFVIILYIIFGNSNEFLQTYLSVIWSISILMLIIFYTIYFFEFCSKMKKTYL